MPNVIISQDAAKGMCYSWSEMLETLNIVNDALRTDDKYQDVRDRVNVAIGAANAARDDVHKISLDLHY